MLSPNLNLILTPFLTGFVGYGTNWLAIKMLFRPHKKSIYSLGWQGVIPKNRAKLAKEIGELVGSKLIKEDDISKAFFSEAVQQRLENAVNHELRVLLEKDYGTISDILSRSGYRPETIVTVILTAINSSGLIDKAFAQAAESVRKTIYGISLSSVMPDQAVMTDAVHKALSSQKTQEMTGNAISASINNFVMSGKSLADIIPQGILEKIPSFSAFITDKILESMQSAFDDDATRSKIASKLVDMKNNHFSDGVMDQMKLGFLNMFLNEDTIRDIVNKYMPSLIKSVKDSDSVKEKIRTSVSEYITSTAKKPLYMHAEAIGMNNLFSLKSTLVSAVQKSMGTEATASMFASAITAYGRNNPEKTLGDVIEEYGFADAVSGHIAKAASPDMSKLSSMICSMAGNVRISNLYSYIPKKVFSKIKSAIIKQTNKVIGNNIEKIVSSIDLPKITEKKINSLDLYEVEDLLFSFMNDSFKWINILGFVIGFAIGAAQSLIMYLS